MLSDKKKSLESYLLLSNKCLEKTLGYESYPMYEVVCMYQPLVSNTFLLLPKFQFHWMFYEERSDT